MSQNMPPEGTSYDRVPYESYPFAETHPERLAVLGHLFGVRTPPLDTCRVLELGCASGGNLIPMAMAMPQAEFVGVDLSAVQIAQGQKAIDDLGLSNIRLLALSITDIDESLGKFDYILTHGVYSWVPNVVQEKILSLCAKQMGANGVAYISYNTLPGWKMRGMIRDLMRYHAMQFDDPEQRVGQARAMLDFLAKSNPAENSAYGMLLQSELNALRNAGDYYILHEHLEDINEPLYFHEFAERAAHHGLQYLAEANFSSMLASNFPPEVNATLNRISPDVIRQEQYMDFLRNRTFRQTLLVGKEVTIERTLTPNIVTDLWISSTLTPVNAKLEINTLREEGFQNPKGGAVVTPNPITKTALLVLLQTWPQRLPFPELFAAARDMLDATPKLTAKPELSAEAVLASDLLQCYTSGLLELHTGPTTLSATVSERPQASRYARWQAQQSLRQITTLRHEIINIEPDQGKFLQLLDGTRDREALYAAAKGLNLMGTQELRTTLAPIQESVDQILQLMARSALLEA